MRLTDSYHNINGPIQSGFRATLNKIQNINDLNYTAYTDFRNIIYVHKLMKIFSLYALLYEPKYKF